MLGNLKNSLVFKLALMYAALFLTSSIIVLLAFYVRASTVSRDRADQELLEEFSELSRFESIDALRAKLDNEVEDEPGSEEFFRLTDLNGEIVGNWNIGPSVDLGAPENVFEKLGEANAPVFTTQDGGGNQPAIRVLHGVFGNSIVLHIGMPLEDNDAYLEIFRRLFAWLILPLCLLACVIGYLMARQALSGVAEVTRTALDITTGSYDQRVQVKKRSAEIERLANVFNGMLDRLQTLIKSMQEMNDNIAHDLRSPLTRIRGAAEMMLIGKAPPVECEELAVATIEECDHLINIINTTLYITETEVGLSKSTLTNVDIGRLVSNAVDLFKNIAEARDITLSAVVPDNCALIGDRANLERLVTNLLENAIKYSYSPSRVTIRVSQDPHNVTIVFEDQGAGIAPDDLVKIFKRFYRCDRSRSSAGIGLGLSLAKAIAEAAGGTIQVQSILGKGSTFTVQLPRRRTIGD